MGDSICTNFPVAGHISNSFNIKIFSATGRCIYSAAKKCEYGSVDISTMGSSGVYLVKISNDHGVKYSGSLAINR